MGLLRTGTYSTPSNFDRQLAANLDGTLQVENYTDLFDPTVIVYPYLFMQVSVNSDSDNTKLGVYYCINTSDITQPSSWKFLYSSTGINYDITSTIDGIINGLGLSINNTTVIVAPGSWRIGSSIYTNASNHALNIDTQDQYLSRYDLVVGDNTGAISLISGTLSSTPVFPNIPDNVVVFGSILITPTSITTTPPPPTGYVKTTGNQKVAGIKTFSSSPVVPIAVNSNQAVNLGQLSAYNKAITLTTTGTSGAATFNGMTLNIPNYSTSGGSSGVSSFNGRTGAVTLSSADITSAIGYTPYNAANPAGYITSSSLSPYQLLSNLVTTLDNSTTNYPSTSAVTTALGNKQANISFSTTGNSGAATFVSNALNIPIYTLAGLGGVSSTSFSATTPLAYNNSTQTFSIQQANTSQAGYLSASDWNRFNTMMPLLGGTFSGDVQQPTAPVNGNSLITKNYVDNIIIGVVWVGVDTATTANITLSGEQTIDGITTSSSRVFVKNQTDQTTNGIYISGTGAWARATNASTGAQIVRLAIIIEGGTTQIKQQWVNTNSSITLGTTNITFTQSSGMGTYTNGTGILLTGTTFSLDTSYTATSGRTGLLLSTDWSTFNNKQSAITLTTTGNSGASTFVTNTLNIPNYTLSGLGGQPAMSGTGYSKFNSSTVSYVSAIPNSDLQYSSITINGSAIALGGTVTTPGFANPMVNAGDLILGGTSGAPTRLGVGVNNYVLTSNGTTAVWAAPSGGSSLSGTQYYVPYYATTSSLSSTSQIWNNGTNVIIGGTTPQTGFLFDVEGKTYVGGTWNATSGNGTGLTIAPTIIATAYGDALIGVDINPSFIPGAYTPSTIGLRSQQLLGVGILTLPTNFAGVSSATGGSIPAGTYYWKIVAVDLVGNRTNAAATEVTKTLTGTTSSVAFTWTAVPYANLYQIYRGTTSGGENLYYQTTIGATSFTDTNTGTQYAQAPPLVNGSAVTYIGVDSTINGVIVGAGKSGLISNTCLGYQAGNGATAGQNVFIGNQAGYTATNTAYSTYVGYNAGKAANNSTGNNAYFGYSVGLSNTGSNNTFLGAGVAGTGTGSYNTVAGAYATGNFTTATGNSIYGYFGAYFLATGTYNVISGYQSYLYGTTGSYNVMMGNNVGFFYSATQTSGTHLTQIDNSILIGNNAAPLANADTNEIVIGYNGLGNGSNTTTIGNTSTLNTYILGGLIYPFNTTPKIGAYTTLATDDVITGDTTASAFTITLLTAVGRRGQKQTVKRVSGGSNVLTVAFTSSQTGDGATSYLLSAQWKYVTFQSDGANWLIVANN